MGVYTALYPGNWLSNIFLTVSLIGISLPTFVIGILLILLFSVNLGWLPSFGRGETVPVGWWTTGLFSMSGWKAIIMPAVTLGLFQMTLIMRLVRAEMLEVLRTDYIRFARARDCPTAWLTLAMHSRTHWCRNYHRRAAIGQYHRILYHRRNCISVARTGSVDHPGDSIRRCADDGGLPGYDCTHICDHQSGGRSAVLRGGSAHAHHKGRIERC